MKVRLSPHGHAYVCMHKTPPSRRAEMATLVYVLTRHAPIERDVLEDIIAAMIDEGGEAVIGAEYKSLTPARSAKLYVSWMLGERGRVPAHGALLEEV